jgi:fructose-specific phosphotransferase system IIA component
MLVVVMHNNKRYLGALEECVRKEGIFNSTMMEEENIGSRLIGDSASFMAPAGRSLPVYNKALIMVVRGEEQLEYITKIIREDARLNVLGGEEKGFVCTMPFSKLKSITLEAARPGKSTELDTRVWNLLNKENILLGLKAQDRETAILEVGGLLKKSDKIADFNVFMGKVMDRENLCTTGIGSGVAIPHARTDSVKDLVLAFGRSSSGVDFKALDGIPAELIFLIGSPGGDKEIKRYLKVLARLAKLLRNPDFRYELIRAATPEEVIECFRTSAETIK